MPAPGLMNLPKLQYAKAPEQNQTAQAMQGSASLSMPSMPHETRRKIQLRRWLLARLCRAARYLLVAHRGLRRCQGSKGCRDLPIAQLLGLRLLARVLLRPRLQARRHSRIRCRRRLFLIRLSPIRWRGSRIVRSAHGPRITRSM